MADQTGAKMFTVDKFLGLNEAGDGDTELQMGEASKMENFTITDAYNLALRPGIRRVDFDGQRTPAPILATWAGFLNDREYFVICDFADDADRIFMYKKTDTGSHTLVYSQSGNLGLTSATDALVHIFPFNGELYIMSSGKTVVYNGVTFVERDAYVPLVIAGAAPAGGGTTLENINLLSPLRRENFSADGTAKAYVLPAEAIGVTKIVVDNEELAVSTAGTFDVSTNTFTFSTAPIKGVGNVEITYTTDPAATEASRKEILSCALHEEYNGSTDTRLFVAGNGTNRCYYTGVTQDGEPSAMYFPAMNEVAVDMSGSSITGIVRHYSKLLVFKNDCTHSISYEPVTLTDGSTVAGFYLRPVNREFGNEVMGQVQIVNNYPRTITKDGIYEWRITTSYYKDERYANRISDVAEQTLKRVDIADIVTCDDDYDKTYYIFLNDSEGTVLVNRYELNKGKVWCVYKSDTFKNVRAAMVFDGSMVFVNETEAFTLDKTVAFDVPTVSTDAPLQIRAAWESGFMHFGADFRRKYSSEIYLSVQPNAKSEVIVTAQTDKRDSYIEKTITNNVLDWSNMSFSEWTFNNSNRPVISRVRLKVKKFVYYKLIFRIDKAGAKGTILGFDQKVRFGSMAK